MKMAHFIARGWGDKQQIVLKRNDIHGDAPP